MRTHTHFLIAALIWDTLNRRRPPIRTGKAFLAGSIVPDVPLMLLTVWYLIHRLQSDNPPSKECPLYGPEYDAYYFDNDYWLLFTSLFHAPLLIMLYLSTGIALWTLQFTWAEPLIWFSASCGLHCFLDIMTQVEDGILILFPFNWDYRFQSWVSYYDPTYGGQIFTPFEYALDAFLILYFIYRGIQSSLNQKRLARYVEVNQYVIDNPIV